MKTTHFALCALFAAAPALAQEGTLETAATTVTINSFQYETCSAWAVATLYVLNNAAKKHQPVEASIEQAYPDRPATLLRMVSASKILPPEIVLSREGRYKLVGFLTGYCSAGPRLTVLPDDPK